jgi:hypothetical protein
MLEELADWDPSAPDELQAALQSKSSSRIPLERALQVGGQGFESDATELPESEISAPAHATADSGTIPYDPDAIPGRGNVPLSPTTTVTRSLVPLRNTRVAVRIALVVGLISLTTGAWLLLHSTKPIDNPVVVPPPPAQAVPFTCRITRAAERVSPRVFMPVAPIALDSPDGQRVALGFAESATTAAGIAVDPRDLSVQFPYRELQDKKIVSVAPTRLGQALSFVTVREGIPLSQARAVTEHDQFLFGVMPSGFARQLAGQTPEIVWPLEAKTVVTDPRIVTVSGLGHAVTFRQGGPNGTIQVGYLTKTGQSVKPPTLVPSNVTTLGTPTLAVSPQTGSPRSVFVTFAGRNAENEPWSIYLSVIEWGKTPEAARVFRLPEDGPGSDAISPSVTGLPEGHWLLQWSEGQTGQRQIRVQLLDATLRPLGKAHTVSPLGSNSGQGLLWTEGTRAVSFFVVSTGKQAELWASSLTCSK